MKRWTKDDHEFVNEALAAVSREVVLASGLSVTEVAAATGYSVSHVSNLLRADGHGQMPAVFLVALVRLSGSREPLARALELAALPEAQVLGAGVVMEAMAEAAAAAGQAEQKVTAAMADGMLSAEEAKIGVAAVTRAMRGFRSWGAALSVVVRMRRGVAFARPS